MAVPSNQKKSSEKKKGKRIDELWKYRYDDGSIVIIKNKRMPKEYPSISDAKCELKTGKVHNKVFAVGLHILASNNTRLPRKTKKL